MKLALSSGDIVTFRLTNGKELQGIIEKKGKNNLKILAENGVHYRVPFSLVQKKWEGKSAVHLQPIAKVEQILPVILSESQRLLENSGLALSVRYKRRVWSTHFRANKHIQYGERCLMYQLTPVKATDNVGANLRRFGIHPDVPSRLAMLVCHEVSHAIAHHRYGPYIAPHGRQFFAVLAELVETEFPQIRRRIITALNGSRNASD